MKETDFSARWFELEFYPRWRTCTATRYEDGVLPRIRKDQVTLFTPWGPRYSFEVRGSTIKPNHVEMKTIARLSRIAEELRHNMPGKLIHWTFMGADSYGVEINHLPASAVATYFASVSEQIAMAIPDSDFCLWSDFSADTDTIRADIDSNFDMLLDTAIVERAYETARQMGRGGDARAYLIERLTEARFIEEILEPIKISCAPKHKDSGVDGTLPCLYLVPEELQAPWL